MVSVSDFFALNSVQTRSPSTPLFVSRPRPRQQQRNDESETEAETWGIGQHLRYLRTNGLQSQRERQHNFVSPLSYTSTEQRSHDIRTQTPAIQTGMFCFQPPSVLIRSRGRENSFGKSISRFELIYPQLCQEFCIQVYSYGVSKFLLSKMLVFFNRWVQMISAVALKN